MSRPVNKPRTIYLLWKVNQAVKVLIDHYGRGEGVTLAQYTALWGLSRRPDSTGAELAREITISPQTMNEVTASLSAAGLIIKRRSPGNKKIWLLSLSDAGRSRLEEIERTIDLAEAAIFKDLPDADLSLLRDLISSVILEARTLQEGSRETEARGSAGGG